MAKNEEKSVIAKIGIGLLIVFCLAFVLVDIWWIFVQFYGDDKTVFDTMKAGQIELIDGSDKKYIFEVNYYSNDNNNGLEMFEIKINYFMDEERESFYSQGIQFVGNTKDSTLKFVYNSDKDSEVETKFWSRSRWFGSYDSLSDGTVHNYASSDDYQTTMGKFTPFGVDSSFRITLSEEIETDDGVTKRDDLYLLKFQGTDTAVEDAYKHATSKVLWYTGDFYSYNDIYLMSRELYESAKTMKRGTSHATVVEFLNFFNFSKFDGSTYVDLNKADTSKVKAEIASYFVIKFNISADGARQASDSVFNNVKGSPTFNLTGDYSSDDYYIGKTIMNVNNNMFDKVQVQEGFVALKLKAEYIEYFSQYKDEICLAITIDKDKLNDEGLEFVGFTADSGLEKFHLKSCETIETINGEIVKSEVLL